MNIHSLPDLFLTRYRMSPVPSKCEKLDCPARVTVLIPDGVASVCGESEMVRIGQPLAEKRLPGTFASCTGKIIRIVPGYRSEGVSCTAVTIEKNNKDGEPYLLFDAIKDVSKASPEELYEKLLLAGCAIPRDKNPFLIRGVDSDSEAVTDCWYLENNFDRVVLGIGVLRRLSPESRFFVAVAETLSEEKKKKLSEVAVVVKVKPYYPSVTTERIIASSPALNNAERLKVMSCSRLVDLISTLETGVSAFTRKILVKSGSKLPVRFFEVSVGMSAGDLFDHAGVKVERGAQVIFGGMLRGRALDDFSQPITDEDSVVIHIPAEECVFSENVSCVNCGRCVRVCPIGLRVDLIAKCVEFAKLDEAKRLGILQCVDCGCCTAACIVHRPLAYHCFYGKKELQNRAFADG